MRKISAIALSIAIGFLFAFAQQASAETVPNNPEFSGMVVK